MTFDASSTIIEAFRRAKDPFVCNKTLEIFFIFHKVSWVPRFPANNSKEMAFAKEIVEKTMANWLEGRELESGEGSVINRLFELVISNDNLSAALSPDAHK